MSTPIDLASGSIHANEFDRAVLGVASQKASMLQHGANSSFTQRLALG
jgi:hypothetical protein